MNLRILHMYPELLNLYGDKGNITSLVKRMEWRGFSAEVQEVCHGDTVDISAADILFLGGGSDREQAIVSGYLQQYATRLKDYVEDGGVLVAVCGGYQLLGQYYELPDGSRLPGLNLLDLYTVPGDKRLIGNTVVQPSVIEQPIVGFENHGGRTYIGSHTPLGSVVKGFGNNGADGQEGVLYKNVLGTYIHGPLFPKNPQLCDYVLTAALRRKYPDFTALPPLDDSAETRANEYMRRRI